MKEGQPLKNKVKIEVEVLSFLPINVPTKNGNILTPMMGEAMLMNQFGRNGVILRNII